MKASVLGVPLPLCSCGVVPTALYLGKSGGSKGAVISFLTSTPQTGVDSIIATYGLMGPLFAAYRAVAAFFSGIFAGIMTNILCRNDDNAIKEVQTTCGCSSKEETPVTSCCSSAPKVEEVSSCCSSAPKVEEVSSCCSSAPKVEEVSSCCSSMNSEPAKKTTFMSKVKSIFTYSFGEFLDEIAFNFVVGLLVAALISTLVPEEWLSSFTNPILSMVLMLIIGIPMYICSTASIPIAVSLIMKGVSPGAAFVFLFAGPVTNIASLAILSKALGKKVLSIYLGSVAVCAIAFGLLLDFIIDYTNYQGLSDTIAHTHEHGKPLYMVIIAIVFGGFVIKSLIKKYTKKA